MAGFTGWGPGGGGGDDVASNGLPFVPFASFVVERSGGSSLEPEMGIMGPKMAQIGLKSTGFWCLGRFWGRSRELWQRGRLLDFLHEAEGFGGA